MAVASFRTPKYGFFLFLAILLAKPWIFERNPAIYESLHAPLMLGIVLLFQCIYSGSFTRLPSQVIKGTVWFTFFLVCCYLSRLFDPMGVFYNRYLAELTNMYLLFIIGISTVKTQEDVRDLQIAILAIMLFLAGTSYYNYKILGWKLPLPSNYFVDRNEFAALLASCIPLCLAYAFIHKKDCLKYVGLCGAILLIICIIPSYSRGAFLSLLLALIICLKLTMKKKTYLLVLALMFLFGSIRVSDKFVDRVSSTADYEQEASAAGRIATYYAAYYMWLEHPILGVGVGNFNTNFWYYCPDKYKIFCAPDKSVHNLFLQILSETGSLGFLTFSVFAWLTVSRGLCSFIKKNNINDEYLIVSLGFSYSLIVLYFSYLFLPGAYNNFIYPLSAAVISAVNAEGSPHE